MNQAEGLCRPRRIYDPTPTPLYAFGSLACWDMLFGRASPSLWPHRSIVRFVCFCPLSGEFPGTRMCFMLSSFCFLVFPLRFFCLLAAAWRAPRRRLRYRRKGESQSPNTEKYRFYCCRVVSMMYSFVFGIPRATCPPVPRLSSARFAGCLGSFWYRVVCVQGQRRSLQQPHVLVL